MHVALLASNLQRGGSCLQQTEQKISTYQKSHLWNTIIIMDTVCVICTVKLHIKTCDIWA